MLRNKHGMSLVEVLISLVILSIVSLAILQSSLVAYRQTTKNQVRDEAVRIGEETINKLKSKAFTQSLTDPELAAGVKAPATVSRFLRKYIVTYTVQTTVTDLTTDTKQLVVTVTWNDTTVFSADAAQKIRTHTVTSILGRVIS